MKKFVKMCTIGSTLVSVGFGSALAADISVEERMAPAGPFFSEFELFAGKFSLSGDALDSEEADDARFSGGAAKVGISLGNGWLALGEIFGEVTTVGDADDSYVFGTAYSGHLAYKTDAWLLGGFGGKIHTDQDEDRSDTSERKFFGVEGQYFLDNLTLYAHGGRLDGTDGKDDDGEDSLREVWFGRMEARYFLDPYTMINGYYAYGHGIMDDARSSGFNRDDSATVNTWGAGIEHKFQSTNISVFTSYQHSNYFQGYENDELDEHTWVAGLKFELGNGISLLERDRNGYSLQSPRELVRWVGQTGGPLE